MVTAATGLKSVTLPCCLKPLAMATGFQPVAVARAVAALPQTVAVVAAGLQPVARAVAAVVAASSQLLRRGPAVSAVSSKRRKKT